MPLRAVMDTNVLYAALRSQSGASFVLLDRLLHGEWTAVVSNHLVHESLDTGSTAGFHHWVSVRNGAIPCRNPHPTRRIGVRRSCARHGYGAGDGFPSTKAGEAESSAGFMAA